MVVDLMGVAQLRLPDEGQTGTLATRVDGDVVFVALPI